VRVWVKNKINNISTSGSPMIPDTTLRRISTTNTPKHVRRVNTTGEQLGSSASMIVKNVRLDVRSGKVPTIYIKDRLYDRIILLRQDAKKFINEAVEEKLRREETVESKQ